MKLGLNIEGIQRSNRCLVLRLMLDKNSMSRVELSKKTGLKKATITNIINEFIEMGIIEECGQVKGEHGRKTDALGLNVSKAKVISLRITRKYFEIQLFDLNGFQQNKHREYIKTSDPINKTFDILKKHLKTMADSVGAQNILGISVAVPGPFIQNEKNLVMVTGFEQLRTIDIKKELEKELNLPVYVEHDAKLATFAEWKYWSYENKQNKGVLLGILSTGQGVGAGIVINGTILKGKFGIAGEIGYMGINFNGPEAESGNRGIYEYYASAESTKRYMLDRLHEFPESKLSESSTLNDIYTEVEKGDPLAKWAIEKTAWYMGYGIAGLVSILSPDKVIIGADYPRSQEFLDAIRGTVNQLVYAEIYDTLNIDFSQIEGNATLLGGFNFVVDCLLNSQQILEGIKQIFTT
ncbi:MAG: ROK family transcriptional regulator [Ruminiclostridium sp.]